MASSDAVQKKEKKKVMASSLKKVWAYLSCLHGFNFSLKWLEAVVFSIPLVNCKLTLSLFFQDISCFTYMEANKGSQRECLQKFDGFLEAASVDSVVRITGNDAFALPGWKFGSKTFNTIQPEHSEDEGGRIIEQKVQNFKENSEFSCEGTMCKTKPLSAHFVINIDEHVKHGCGVAFPLKVLSDLYPADRATGQSPRAHEVDPDSTNWKKIQIERSSEISLRFQDVKYKVEVKGTKKLGAEKYILHGITGSVQPGEVLALMGPSGGGKTTLLNILSGRFKFSSGSITYNGRLFTKSLNRRIGFVTQDDILYPHLTVKETLVYAALLRLPNILTRQQKRERAISVISELGLERCQNTVIGGRFFRGISGGERKRVCIGNEILLNPSLLFLDEPTSGLDSTTALRMVQKLQSIAEAGKTVVTTIHQPSSRLFSKFDKLILLAKGNALYFGKASDAMLHFSSIGCCPLIAMNPAEFLIDLANGNINDKTIPSELEDKFLPGSIGHDDRNGGASPDAIHEYLLDAYKAEVMKTRKPKSLKHVVIEGKAEMQEKMNSREWTATWWEQFSILFRRGLKERRHEYFSLMRITQVIATSIIIGLLWWHPDHDASSPSPRQLQDQAGLLFFISVFWGFLPVFTAIFTFPQERAMLVKERSVGMYRLSAYFASRNISDLPLDLILPTVFLLIVYFMAGLKLSFSAFSLTLLAIYLCIIAAQGLGLTLGAAFMDVKKATTLASIIIMTFMLSGGFFLQKVPPFISWIRYISFNFHTYRLFLKIQYAFSGPAGAPGSCNQYRLIREPRRVDWGATEVGAMMVMIIVYRLLAYTLLRKLDVAKMA